MGIWCRNERVPTGTVFGEYERFRWRERGLSFGRLLSGGHGKGRRKNYAHIRRSSYNALGICGAILAEIMSRPCQ